jgi:hypothetical protein
MFDKILGGLTLVRHAVAITLVMGAATATVAGSIDVAPSAAVQAAAMTTSATASTSTNKNTSDLEAAIRACLATKDSQSAECLAALDQSGLSNEDFWAKLAFSLSEKVATKSEPSHDAKLETAHPATGELLGLVTACVESHERSSEACASALALSGLTPDEFFAKVSALFQHGDANTEPAHTTKPEPAHTTKPETTKSTDEAVGLAVKACLARFEAYRTGSATTEPISTSEVCRKAYEATGLTMEQFWAKFGPKPTTTATTKPTSTTKPTTTPSVSTAQLEVLVKDCFAKYLAAVAAKGSTEAGTAASDACHTAISASGLAPQDFWAKFGTPSAPR